MSGVAQWRSESGGDWDWLTDLQLSTSSKINIRYSSERERRTQRGSARRTCNEIGAKLGR